jgi:glycerate-2-kinase
LGFHTLVLTSKLQGEAREAAKLFGTLARDVRETGRPVVRPALLVAGGELTVTVTGRGKGGRCQELALAAAKEIAGLSGTTLAAFGTDGTDGPTDAAGAVVDDATLLRAARRGLDPDRFLARNDSYHFFKKLGGLIQTGPTGTNVNDIYLLLVR